jgi:membrane-bound serine protease (ClpP class)
LLLILTALGLFILEAKYTSHGVLALGGIVAMLLGAMFLVRSPLTAGGVSPVVALATTLPFAAITVMLMRLVLRSRGWKAATGKEQLIGAQGVVTTALTGGGEGIVRVHGELWRAVANEPIAEAKNVRVVRVDGLRMRVEPVDSAGS